MASNKDGRSTRASGRRFGSARRQGSQEVGTEDRISTIRAGQGARVTTRKNASVAAGRARAKAEERYYKRHPEAKAAPGGPERSGKNVALLVVASVVALVLVFLIGSCVVALVTGGDPGADVEQQRNEQNLNVDDGQQAADPDDEQAGLDGTVSYKGTTYSLVQEDGRWAVVGTGSGGSADTLFYLEGTPVAIARRKSTLLIPENRDGSWDVVCYVISVSTNASYVVGSDGKMVQGSGDATEVKLDGTTLRVTDSSGATTDVPVE